MSPYMFSNSGITSLTIPNTVETIKEYAFEDCENLSTVNIVDGNNPLIIENVNISPFYQSPLTNIHLGREIKGVGGTDYSPASSATGLFCTEKYDDVDNVVATISENVKTISPYMFSNLKLKSITIPATVNEGEELTIRADGVVLYDTEVLTVTVNSDFTLKNAEGAQLGYTLGGYKICFCQFFTGYVIIFTFLY